MSLDTTPEISQTSPTDGPAFGERRIGFINMIGLWTLYKRETHRFIKVWTQTLAAPAVTTILFMVIFDLALGGRGRIAFDLPFSQFLAPGLMVMAMLQNAFANTSSSLLISKVQGNIVDTLMAPLSALELTLGYIFGGITRGIFVGVSVGLAFLLMPGVVVEVAHFWALVYFTVAATMLMSLAGILTGIWAEKFDHAAAISNFIIAPLTLLSGTFYSISRLPENWQAVSALNPFFYLIDGFRYGFIGHADSDLMVGVFYMFGLNAFLVLCVYRIFKTGYRLKA